MSLHQDQKTLRWEFKKRKRYARNHANDQEQENSNFQEKSKKTTLLTKRKSSLRSHLFSFINSNRCWAYILQLSDLPVKAYLVFGSTGSGQDPLGRVPRSGPRPHDAWTGLTRMLSINIFQIFIKLLYFIIETKLIYIHEFIRGKGWGGLSKTKISPHIVHHICCMDPDPQGFNHFFPPLFFLLHLRQLKPSSNKTSHFGLSQFSVPTVRARARRRRVHLYLKRQMSVKLRL